MTPRPKKPRCQVSGCPYMTWNLEALRLHEKLAHELCEECGAQLPNPNMKIHRHAMHRWEEKV